MYGIYNLTPVPNGRTRGSLLGRILRLWLTLLLTYFRKRNSLFTPLLANHQTYYSHLSNSIVWARHSPHETVPQHTKTEARLRRFEVVVPWYHCWLTPASFVPSTSPQDPNGRGNHSQQTAWRLVAVCVVLYHALPTADRDTVIKGHRAPPRGRALKIGYKFSRLGNQTVIKLQISAGTVATTPRLLLQLQIRDKISKYLCYNQEKRTKIKYVEIICVPKLFYVLNRKQYSSVSFLRVVKDCARLRCWARAERYLCKRRQNK